MKKTKEQPINVALPNTTEQKMAAIVAVANAINNLSKALISSNVNVTVANNTVNYCDVGLKISSPDSA